MLYHYKHLRGDKEFSHTWSFKLPQLFEEAIEDEDGLEEFRETRTYKFKEPHRLKNFMAKEILQIIRIEPGDIYEARIN